MTDLAPVAAASVASGSGSFPSTRLGRLGAATARHPWRVVVTWVVLTGAAFALAVAGVGGGSLFSRLSHGAPGVPGEARTAQTLLTEQEPRGTSLMLQVRDADLGSPSVLQTGADASAALTRISGVAKVSSPFLAPAGPADPAVAPLLRSGDPSSRAFLLVVDLAPGLGKPAEQAAEEQVTAQLRALVAGIPGASGEVGGVRPLLQAITAQIEADLRAGEGIALPLSFLVMVLVFGGVLAAGMPITGAVASIGGALASLYGFSFFLDLDASVVNVVTLLGLGLSIDYGLLTVSRFREELAATAPAPATRRPRPGQEQVAAATARTVAAAGRTVLFSGLTVAIALAGLLVFEADIMRAIGAAGVSVVLVAVLVNLTLVPALCALGGRRLSARSRRGADRPTDHGVFSRLAAAVQRRPLVVIVLSVAVLVVLALPVLSIRLTSSGTELLPRTAAQRVFFDDLARDYPALAAPDVTVVARGSMAQVQAWASGQLAAVPGVERVEPRQLSPDLVAVGVRVAGAPTDQASTGVVEAIRDHRPPFQTWVTGQAAGQLDFLASMGSRAPYAVGLVVLGTFLLLFLMTGSLVVPLKALLLNVVSLGAALGVVVFVFQDGRFAGLLDFTSVGAVESMIPFLVLAFGFGLSMDYEVFLLSRIAELHRRGVPNDEAVALGLQRSGRIITSAAVLIVIVFAGFAAGKLLIIKEMGVALVAAVALDASLVRMLLVPATMTLLGRWNWWAPGPLRRWHERHGLTD